MTQDASNARSDVQGWALTRLLEIHDGMRNDLALLRSAVGAFTEDGHDADMAAAELNRLSIKEPGWTLRGYCARFCSFVHEHHATEDTMMFPMLLEQAASQDTEFVELVAKLQADHRTLASYLDDMDRALGALSGDAAAMSAAADAVRRLSELLEAHLRFEEENLAPALAALSSVVSEDDVPAPPPEAFGVSGSSGAS
jgi:hypothetical protein